MAHGAVRQLTWVLLLLNLLAAATSSLAAPIDEFHRIVQLARVYQQNGYRQQALMILRDAEQFDVSAQERANLDLHLAQLYFELGQYPRSDAKLKALAANTGLSAELRISALNLSAALASTLNNPSLAHRDYQQATALARKELPAYTLVTQTNHLRHTLDYGDWRTGVTLSAEILAAAKQLNATAGEIEIRISVAELLLRLANLSGNQTFRGDAINLLKVAAEHAALRDLSRLQSFALGYHGQALLDGGDSHAALDKLNQASFLASSSNAFESTYLWQWQTARGHRMNGNNELAIAGYQTAIESLEYVRADLITGSPFTFPQKIQPLFAELSSLLLHEARLASNVSEQQDRLRQVQSLLEQAKSAELQDYFQNDCVIPDETVDLNQIAEATAVIYPVVLPDRLEILVNIGNVIHQYSHAISARELESLVNEFRDNLQRDQGDDEYLLIGQELHQMLFADAEPRLKAEHIDTLLVIPDASLRTIPFSALHDGKQFLIEKYAIATTPGINLTLPKPLDVQQANFFAGGISDAVQGFSGLPGVPVELARLKEGYGAEVLQDGEFNRSAVQSQLASENYSIVHIATHGHFDSNPQESFLLAYDDKLTMDLLEESIGSRRQAGNPLELLVLSACETAVGDNRAALGLAGVALKAGARSAVATLWQISDAATVEIIQAFYDQSNHPAQTKAKALRAAQQRLIASERFYHPSDWAPFLLIGNWL